MKYCLVHDKLGRMRVRFGVHMMSPEQGYGICALLQEVDGVTSATSNHINGSILILYTAAENRAAILAVLDSLQRELLPIVAPTNEQVQAEAKARFQCTLIEMAIKKLVCDTLLPTNLFKAVVFFKASRYIRRMVQFVWRRNINVDVLDGAAISASLCHGSVSSASSVMLLLRLSEHISEYTKYRARNVLTKSLALNIEKVWMVKDGIDILVPLAEIQRGDQLRIQMGQLIPVDGTVVSGEALINESSMTGEPVAAFKSEGKTVFAGTAIEEGSLVIEVRKKAEETRISQILQLIESGEHQKSLVQSKLEHIADKIVPYNFLLFGAVFLLTRDVHKAMAVLMVDYSCALKIATPITVLSAMRQSATYGVLVKGGKHFESFAAADTIVFDKTGTLTSASPKVAKVLPLNDCSEEEILRMAACLEEHFPHSVANAIVKAAEDKELQHEERHTDVKYIVAHGICADYEGKETLVGSRHYVLEDNAVTYDKAQLTALNRKIAHYSPIYIAQNGELLGVICIEDPPRKESKATIAQLKALGIERVIMLTGDNQKTAKAVAKKLQIDEVYAEVLPQDKADLVDKLKAEGHKVIMVGDGVNDSPALAKADVSVALKDSSGIAREVADIVITSGDLAQLCFLRELSLTLTSRIQYNFKFAVGFNSALLGIGLFGGNPTTTALFHNLSTLGLAAYNTRDLIAK